MFADMAGHKRAAAVGGRKRQPRAPAPAVPKTVQDETEAYIEKHELQPLVGHLIASLAKGGSSRGAPAPP